jgi:hypothetical protein
MDLLAASTCVDRTAHADEAAGIELHPTRDFVSAFISAERID